MGGWHKEVKCEGLGGGEYFEDLYNIDTQEQVIVHMCGFDGIWRVNYLATITEESQLEELRLK